MVKTPEAPKIRPTLNATLCFLVKEEANQIRHVCLGLKLKGFGRNKWNGFGGKKEPDESIIDTAVRETREECCVMIDPTNLEKVAELTFFFPGNPDWDQIVHVYLARIWQGTPQETAEMRPKWFGVDELQFESMWIDDPLWLPLVLNGKLVVAEFVFGKDGNEMLSHEVTTVDNF